MTKLFTLLSNGNLNAGGPALGYARTISTPIDYKDGSKSHSIIKHFHARGSYSVASYGTGSAPATGATFVPWLMHLAQGQSHRARMMPFN